jgi:RNA polymerase sigma factor (sigma-70 family)
MLLAEKRELLESFRAGKRAALEEVYRHYAPEVANFLQRGFGFQSRGRDLRFTGYQQPFDLDNAIQETFTRAFKESARNGYDGIHSYKNYLLAIARNFVLDELRNREVAMSPFIEMQSEAAPEAERHDGEEAGVVSTGVSDGPSRGTSAEHDYLRNELAKLYAEFVASLDERDRIFFAARFEEQLGQVEAGARCDLSHMQARTLEKKLRSRFLKFMQTHGYLDGYAPGEAKKVATVLSMMVM